MFFFVVVFLFFNRRPSHIRDTLTYGSGKPEGNVVSLNFRLHAQDREQNRNGLRQLCLTMQNDSNQEETLKTTSRHNGIQIGYHLAFYGVASN